MVESSFRLQYEDARDTLKRRLAEPPPTRIQLLAGPRQVGKTTLLLSMQEDLGHTAIYAAADAPEAALPGFWERLWSDAEAIAAVRGRAVVLLDELPLLRNWPGLLKGVWDRFLRLSTPIHIVATGSSALRLAAGARETLAGRFERLTLTHWSATSLSVAFGLAPKDAASVAVQFGTYPGAIGLLPDRARWLAYLRDSIVEPAIGRDILALEQVRRPALLRQVFALAATSPARIVSLQKLQGQLTDRGALETIAHYLSLLEDAFLVAPVEKYSEFTLRRRSAPPKLVTLNNALLAAADPRGAPDLDSDPARHGLWVENACLAHAINAGYQVAYWREEPLEVDAVIERDHRRWAVEIKTSPFVARDLRGLFEFTRRHRDYRPLVLCNPAQRDIATRAGAVAQDWRDFLLSGPVWKR